MHAWAWFAIDEGVDLCEGRVDYSWMDQPPQPTVNLLHPLTTLEWSEYRKTPVCVYNAQAVVLEDKVYIGGGRSSSRLLIYDFIDDTWDTLETPTEWYALTSYQSQLVLVGGGDPNCGRATNQLWVLDEQYNWNQPLPFMTTNRYQASAVSIGDHLIVAGGSSGGQIGPLDAVEVYDGQWRRAQSFPIRCSWMKSTLHEGNWYLAGGIEQGHDVYYTSVESLITTTNSEGAGQTSVWKKLPITPLEGSTPAMFKNQLVTIGEGYPFSSAIYAYSSSNNSWVHVGDLPVACYSICTLVLPTGELLVVGGDTESGLSSYSFRANIEVTSILGGYFDMSALDRLEKVAGIPIFNKLAPKFLKMASALHFHESCLDSLRTENNPVEGSKMMVKAWLSGESYLPPTWQKLLEMFQSIEMGEIAQKIEEFFNMPPATSQSASLMSESKKGEFELDMSAIESRELQTKPDHKDVAIQSSPERQDVAVQTYCESTAVEIISGSFCGVEVIGEVLLTIQNQGGLFEWKGYGFKLHVPEGSLPAGVSGCRIKIRASLSGQFQLPKDSDFISPVFWITAPCKFTKPVTLEIQHCAFREHDTTLCNLSFVSAKCSQKDLPYRFRQVDGGVFTLHSSYGSIQLSHFSGFGITGGKRTPRSYCAHLYHTKKQTYDWRYYFVITQDLDAKNMVVRDHYGHFATKEATLRIGFVRSEITLDIPVDGLVTREGWKITPLTFPTISRKDADQFQPGQWIPECQLIVQWKREDQRPVQLMHKVDLIGAKAPYNYFHLALNPAWEGADPVPPRRMETDSEVDPEVDPEPLMGETSNGGRDNWCLPPTKPLPDEKPNLVNLISFPGKSGSINIPQQISTKYFMFGVLLLNDETGAEVSAIVTKYHGDAEQINLEILRLWIRGRGKPLSWNILIGVLKEIGLDTLASDIKKGRFPIPHHSPF